MLYVYPKLYDELLELLGLIFFYLDWFITGTHNLYCLFSFLDYVSDGFGSGTLIYGIVYSLIIT
jgi:hypothetical protein